MSNIKISQLPAATTPDGTELVPIVQSSTTKRTTVATLLADQDASSFVGYLPAGSGAVATTVQAKLRETVSVKDFGAVGNGVADDTAAIQAAIDYGKANPGITIYFPRGTYKITDSLDLTLCIGLTLRGESWGYFGLNGVTIEWHGGTVKSMVICDFTKGGVIENLTLRGADTTTNKAFACIHYIKGASTGSSGVMNVMRCYFDNAQYGMRLGETPYDSTWNASEVFVGYCYFARNLDCGFFNIGIPSTSQMVNNVLFTCHFNSVIGVWIDGGNVVMDKCTWNGFYNTVPTTCVYITGDRSLTHPSVIRDGYAEQVCKIVETEFTASSTEFYRSGKLIIESGYYNCNKPAGDTPYFVECYKNMDIEIRGVVAINSSGVLYSPPITAAGTPYSANAPSAGKLSISGSMTFGALTCSRGGYVVSTNPYYENNITSGTVFPDKATGELTVSTYIQSLPEYMHYASTGGTNGTFDISTITGGKTGDTLHLYASPTLVASRNWVVKNNVGNIYTATGADFALDTATKKIVLRKDSLGKWFEIGRIAN